MVSKIILVAGFVASFAASACAGTTSWIDSTKSSLATAWDKISSQLPTFSMPTVKHTTEIDVTSSHARALELTKRLLSTGRFASLTAVQKQTAVHDALVRAGINPEHLVSEPGLWSRFTQWLDIEKYIPKKRLGLDEQTGLDLVKQYIAKNNLVITNAQKQIERYDAMSKGIGNQFGIDLSIRNKDALSVAAAQKTFFDDVLTCYDEATKTAEYAADTLLSPTLQQAVAAYSKGVVLTEDQKNNLVRAAKLVRNQFTSLNRCLTKKETALLEKVTKALSHVKDSSIKATEDFVHAFDQNAHSPYVEKTFGADVAARGEAAIFEGVIVPEEISGVNQTRYNWFTDIWEKLNKEYLPKGSIVRVGGAGVISAVATYGLVSLVEKMTGQDWDWRTKGMISLMVGAIAAITTCQCNW